MLFPYMYGNNNHHNNDYAIIETDNKVMLRGKAVNQLNRLPF